MAGVEGMDERLQEAVVEYRTVWSAGRGYLVGDARTVVVLGHIPNTGRRITVRRPGGGGVEARVASLRAPSGRGHGPFAVLRLDADLDGVPLQPTDAPPGLGARVYVPVLDPTEGHRGRHGDDEGSFEIAETAVTAASEHGLALGTAPAQLRAGAPVLGDDGRLVGFVGHGGSVVRIARVLDEEALAERGMPVLPVLGFRLGTEFGGFLDQPFVMDFDIGLALWDQLGIGLRIGFGAGREDVYRIEPDASHEQGVVSAYHGTFDLGIELEYRLLLTRSPIPFYVDLAVGVAYVVSIVSPRGPALYSTRPGCDPVGGDCDLTVGSAPSRFVEHAVGPSFGADVRAGAFTIGYRFVPEALSYGMGDTHRLTFGISVF